MINIAVLTQNRKAGLMRLFSSNFWDSLNPALLYNHYVRLVVLDQGSTDGTVEYLKELQPKEDILYMPIFSDYNYGCGGGRQRIVDRLMGGVLQPEDIIVFLDDDLEVELMSWLHLMLAPLQDPTLRVDIVGCEAMEITDDFMTSPAIWTPGYAEYVSGGWSAFRASLFEAGLAFDPRFNPNYWEDVDICVTARARGHRVFATGPCGLLHRSESDGVIRMALYQANREKFKAKWEGKLPDHKVSVYYGESV